VWLKLSFDDGWVDRFDISVVVACYTEDRFDGIRRALESVRKQSLEPRTVVVAVDNNESLADRLRAEFDWVTVVLNQGDRGSSATRNRGVESVKTSITAFLDDDETADEDWLLELSQPFTEQTVVGTGGTYEAVWARGKPSWFPDEFAWVVGGSYLGMPTETQEVRNVWAGNMAVRTAAFRALGGFRAEFGKHQGVYVPEDTDLCIRLTAANEGRWIYVPAAVVDHAVPTDRASLRFFVSRCFSEGRGKVLMSRGLGSSAVLAMEHAYVKTSVRAAARHFARRSPSEMLQGTVILLGLASAGAGYWGQWFQWRRRERGRSSSRPVTPGSAWPSSAAQASSESPRSIGGSERGDLP
jgi:GT2 family glycosyltransferase